VFLCANDIFYSLQSKCAGDKIAKHVDVSSSSGCSSSAFSIILFQAFHMHRPQVETLTQIHL